MSSTNCSAAGPTSTRPASTARDPIQLTNGDYYFRGWRDVPHDWPTTPQRCDRHLRARGAYCDICTACHIGDLDRVRELLDEDPSLANRVAEYVTYYFGSGIAAEERRREGASRNRAVAARPRGRSESARRGNRAARPRPVCGRRQPALRSRQAAAGARRVSESAGGKLGRRAFAGDFEFRPADDRAACARTAPRGRWNCWPTMATCRTAAAVLAANPRWPTIPTRWPTPPAKGRRRLFACCCGTSPICRSESIFPGWLVGAKTRELNELLFAHGMNPSQPDWLLHHAAAPIRPQGRRRKRRAVHRPRRRSARARRRHLLDAAGLGGQVRSKADGRAAAAPRRRPNLPDDPPWATPLAWATRRGHGEIAELLEAARRNVRWSACRMPVYAA